MGTDLLDLILSDHRRIRSALAELQVECGQKRVDDDAATAHFRTLKALVVSHAKAEEFTLYALFETEKAGAAGQLQHFTFEGYEEHDLIDFLMKEMVQAEEITLQWRAQLKVLAEMLERHLNEEERAFLPRVRRLVPGDRRRELGAEYEKERDAIYIKKLMPRSEYALLT